jgi:hypothetical protein
MHTKWSLEVGIFPSPLNFLEACFARTNTPKRKHEKTRQKTEPPPATLGVAACHHMGRGCGEPAHLPLQPSTFFKIIIIKPDITSVIQCGLCTKGGFSTHHSTVPRQLETKQTYANKTQDYMKK